MGEPVVTSIWVGIAVAIGRRTVTLTLVMVLAAVGIIVAPPAADAAESPFLDQTFASGGKLVKDLGGLSRPRAVEVDSAGRVVMIGTVDSGNRTDRFVLRLLPSGQPDPSFGVNGMVSPAPGEDFGDLRITAGDKIVILGTTDRDGWYGIPAIMRLDVDGSVDATFGNSGVATLPSDATIQPNEAGFAAFDLAPDGSLAVAGSKAGAPGTGSTPNVWKFSSTGTLETDFDKVATIQRPANADSWVPSDVDIDARGRVIVVGGGTWLPPGRRTSSQFASILTFLSDGRADTSFGEGGELHQFEAGPFTDVETFANGTIAVAAYKGLSAYQGLSAYSQDGVPLPAISSPTGLTLVSLDVDSNNRLVVGGWTLAGSSHFVLMRFKSDRTADGTFGSGGQLSTEFAQGQSFMADTAIAPDGKIIAAGHINFFGTPEQPVDESYIALARYHSNTGYSVKQLNDYSGDGKADVLARDSGGILWLYPGNGIGGWQARVRVGSGWNVMTSIVASGDLSGDGKADVLARDVNGVLWLYPGNGRSGWLTRMRTGSGWNVMNYLVSPGDFNGDGRGDLLTRDTSGVLWLYPGAGRGAWQSRMRVGSGWNVMSALVGPGDFNGDEKTDLLARDSSGVLWLYPGDSRGGWLPRLRVGTGWNVMNAIVGPGDFNGDTKVDVMARDGAGVLWLYPSSGSGGWMPRQRIGSGWNVMTAVN